MTTPMTDLEEQLEALIDAHGLTAVLNNLEGVCGLKAHHIRTNWPATNSDRLANRWARLARVINRAWATSYDLGL